MLGAADHFAAFLRARRTSASSVASAPSSSCAALTAALASAGLKPRLARAERRPPRHCRAAPAHPADRADAELALKFIGDARGELGADTVGAADHRLVFLRDGAGELVGRQHRQDGQREPAADALDRGQRAKGVALVRPSRSRTASRHPRAPEARSGSGPRRRSGRARRASCRCNARDSRPRRRRSPRCRRPFRQEFRRVWRSCAQPNLSR